MVVSWNGGTPRSSFTVHRSFTVINSIHFGSSILRNTHMILGSWSPCDSSKNVGWLVPTWSSTSPFLSGLRPCLAGPQKISWSRVVWFQRHLSGPGGWQPWTTNHGEQLWLRTAEMIMVDLLGNKLVKLILVYNYGQELWLISQWMLLRVAFSALWGIINKAVWCPPSLVDRCSTRLSVSLTLNMNDIAQSSRKGKCSPGIMFDAERFKPSIVCWSCVSCQFVVSFNINN